MQLGGDEESTNSSQEQPRRIINTLSHMSEDTQYLRMLLYEWDIREDVNQALGIPEDFMQDAHGTISEISFKILAGPRPSRI